jgi:uncharacterized protein (TIGR00251 family)
MKITETQDGAIIEIFVKPNSREFKLTIENEELIVQCTEEPTKGKVNKELLKEFTKLFRKKVELTSGATSREKRLLIKGARKAEVERMLQTTAR